MSNDEAGTAMRALTEREAKAVALLVRPEGPKFEILRLQAAVAKAEDTVDSAGSFLLWVPPDVPRFAQTAPGPVSEARGLVRAGDDTVHFIFLLWCEDGALHWVECISSHDVSLAELDRLDGFDVAAEPN